MRSLLTGLLLAFVPFSAAAAQTAEVWTEVRSPHFTVLTNASEWDARHVAGQFERMREVLRTYLPSVPNQAEPSTFVLALEDKKSYEDLVPPVEAAGQDAGIFVRGLDKNYALIRLDLGPRNRWGAYSDYTRYMLRYASDWLPLWLQTGLTEFYGTADVEDHYALLGASVSSNMLLLAHTPLIPFPTLLAVNYQSLTDADSEVKKPFFDAESWALTHYLILADHNQHTNSLRGYMQVVQQHADPVEAAARSFGDLGQLQKLLTGYLHFVNLQTLKVSEDFAVDVATFKARSLAPAAVNVVRAEVLTRTGRLSDAEPLLTAVLASDPKNEPALEALGYLQTVEKDVAGANRSYAQALQLNPRSFLAQYGYAITTNTGDRSNDDKVESALHAAIEINPAYAPAYDALGQFYLKRHEKLEEAKKLSLQAVQLEPDVLSFHLDTADVLAQQKDFAGALKECDIAFRMTQTDDQYDMVQDRADKIEDLRDDQANKQ